jgi:hypothetical protein
MTLDDFPTYSSDPELSPPSSRAIVPYTGPQKEQNLRTLLRFLLGTALEGNDEFWRRARVWQAEMEKSTAAPPPIYETEAARLRFALLGIFVQSLDYASAGLKSVQQRSGRFYRRFNRLVNPLVNNRLTRPIQRSTDRIYAKGESVFEAWIRAGRQEEQLSRSLVREQALDDLVNQVLDYVAAKPEIRDLVQDQGMGMAEEVVGEFRSRSTDVDNLLARIADNLLRRAPKDDQEQQP